MFKGRGQEAEHIERAYGGAFYMFERGEGAKQVERALKGTFYMFKGGEGSTHVERAPKGARSMCSREGRGQNT